MSQKPDTTADHEPIAPGVYARAQARGQEVLRASLLDVAARLLAAEGPAALTMRRIAAEAGCSTMILYKHFGSKDSIAAALYLEGFARLKLHLDAVPRAADPAEYLAAVGQAYRESALAEPNFYDVMHGPGIPGYSPDARARAAARQSLAALHIAAQRCIEAGIFRLTADPEEITDVLWAAAHGIISLERAGHITPATAAVRYRTITTAAAAAFAVTPTPTPAPAA
ncbi:TetR/AcrR family transcriptional regulator [Catenulispora rubra]|uniref:TetR/AcrR family transcriptional regulator n=1 Tax=Catenulispora rubra TaxID=280293 RepID=UPI0018928194|nr:TetR/AcrR family transcriptional regulator [Catenulispora rubra]